MLPRKLIDTACHHDLRGKLFRVELPHILRSSLMAKAEYPEILFFEMRDDVFQYL